MAQEDILEFTPEADAPIEGVAASIVNMMEEYDMDCEVHFPDFTMEVPKDTPVKEIIAAYHEFCKQVAEAMKEEQ